MSEETREVYDLMRTESKERRARNRTRALDLLRKKGVAFQVKNHGAHLIITHRGLTIDYWPGTGKWRRRLPGDPGGRGIHTLLMLLQQQEINA